jgi:hypothetical protein
MYTSQTGRERHVHRDREGTTNLPSNPEELCKIMKLTMYVTTYCDWTFYWLLPIPQCPHILFRVCLIGYLRALPVKCHALRAKMQQKHPVACHEKGSYEAQFPESGIMHRRRRRRKPAHYFPALKFPLPFHIMTGPASSSQENKLSEHHFLTHIYTQSRIILTIAENESCFSSAHSFEVASSFRLVIL